MLYNFSCSDIIVEIHLRKLIVWGVIFEMALVMQNSQLGN